MGSLVIPVFLPELGCLGKCIYCDQRQISGQGEIPAPSHVRTIIENHLATWRQGPDDRVEVAFFGGTFTNLPEGLQREYLDTVRPFMAGGLVEAIRVSTRPDAVDEAAVGLLARGGVWLVELGAQSLDDRVLEESGRGYSSRDVVAAVRTIQEGGLAAGLQLMPGLPGSSRDSDVRSAEKGASLGVVTARIYPTLVLAGTELERRYRKGEYRPLTLEEAVEVAADMCQALEAKGVKVIRMGLQATTDLMAPGTVVAGPFHPAFGELVRSRIMRRRMEALLEAVPPSEAEVILVSTKELSQAIGQERCNVKYLETEFKRNINIRSDNSIPEGVISLANRGICAKKLARKQETWNIE